MNKIIKNVLYTVFFLIAGIAVLGLGLAYIPTPSKIKNKGITPAEAALLRKQFTAPHNQFTTTDGLTLFLRRWNPDTITPAKKILPF